MTLVLFLGLVWWFVSWMERKNPTDGQIWGVLLAWWFVPIALVLVRFWLMS